MYYGFQGRRYTRVCCSLTDIVWMFAVTMFVSGNVGQEVTNRKWLLAADPPRKRIDTRQINGASSRLSLGNISEGSPLSSRRALAIHNL